MWITSNSIYVSSYKTMCSIVLVYTQNFKAFPEEWSQRISLGNFPFHTPEPPDGPPILIATIKLKIPAATGRVGQKKQTIDYK